MPILNSAVNDDKQQAFPIGLQTMGPRVVAEVSFLQEQRDGGQRPPVPVVGTALIDTGASSTAIDIEVAQKLGLPVVGRGVLQTAAGSSMTPIFAGIIKVQGLGEIRATQAYGVQIAHQELVALLGRDILRACVFHYNGPAASYSLSL